MSSTQKFKGNCADLEGIFLIAMITNKLINMVLPSIESMNIWFVIKFREATYKILLITRSYKKPSQNI